MKYITVYSVAIPHRKPILVVQTNKGYLKAALGDYKTRHLVSLYQSRYLDNKDLYDFTEYDHEKECYMPVAGYKKLVSYTEKTHPELFI